MFSKEGIGRIGEEGSRSDLLMMPIAVFLENQVYHHVHLKLAEERLLNSQELFQTGKGDSFPSRHSTHWERKGGTDSTIDSSDTADIRLDSPVP